MALCPCCATAGLLIASIPETTNTGSEYLLIVYLDKKFSMT